MINPPPSSYAGSGSRRPHYSRSPSDNTRPSKRAKASNSNDSYDRDHGNGSDQSHPYSIICVKNINPVLSDSEIRDLCNKKFSRYGSISARIYHRGQERVAFVYFSNYEQAREARYTKTGLIWANMQVILEPVFYRAPMLTEQPIISDNLRERSPINRRRRRRTPRSPSPPINSYHRVPSRRQRANSPYGSSRSLRSSRRNYAPYIPLPPDLAPYATRKSSRKRQKSSPSPARRSHHHHKEKPKQKRSRTPSNHRSSSSQRTNVDDESNVENEPTRTLSIENLDRNITESKLRDVFGRYGTIKEIDLKKSSKRTFALIQFENVDMAFEARRDMNGQTIGKTDCKIAYGKVAPTKYLWVGNIPVDIKRRDIEHAFSRYGQIKTLDYSTGDPAAVITYCDVEDAVKARSKLNGTIKIIDGRAIRSETDTSPSSRRGFRIDYLDRPTSRRFVIVRPQRKSSNRHESRSSSRSRSPASSKHDDRERSPSNDTNANANNDNDNNKNDKDDQANEENSTENVKTERHSPPPTPPVSSVIKQRRSTDRSESQVLPNPSPIAGRTFYGALGSYLSTNDTTNVNNLNDLMILCEQLNASATKSNTALSTVYPVQFILKSHAYDARLHFLAGSPTLASILLGQPGDLIAAKTELRITQRLRLSTQKLDELERIIRNSAQHALIITGNNSHANVNGHTSNGSASGSGRKQISIANQTKFSILIASPKIQNANNALNSNEQKLPSGKIKNEMTSPSHSDGTNDKSVEVKKEKIDQNEHNNNAEEEDEDSPLSQLVAYLLEKEAAGVISTPFHPTYQIDHSSRQEIAVIHIFPPCQLTQKILKTICPSINFANELIASPIQPSVKSDDEHIMVIIVHNE